MIKVDIPQDVTEYKEQFFFGFTARQFACAILMLVIGILFFLIGSKLLPTTVLVYAVIIFEVPVAAVGFLKYNGMPFEIIAKTLIEYYAGTQKRKMKFFPEEMAIHDEVRKIYLSALEKEYKENKKKSRK